MGADHTHEFDPQDIQNNKGVACISYLGPLFLIPLFSAPNSKFARFHVNQGLLLFLVDVAASIVVGFVSLILNLLFFWNFFFASLLISLVSGLLGLLLFVVSIVFLIDAANGRAREIPVIGKFRLIK